ncbi:uncharacterized protein BDZ99DRAFT_174303 [Mytilinidion resinicola]|uniref:Uncharacterized protein n=1 Tax=Mytilinidion resinicola TaxID=574789 RepID=A0A6A6Y2P9_9PEZI|nr:uncharacterized protein BDZ99DRAFT_174303 [Mytilinidion resinicola]KAF2803091.1 hypothetical protein BDZ99DRAFT_174303 [Mytilinidion resinicola]
MRLPSACLAAVCGASAHHHTPARDQRTTCPNLCPSTSNGELVEAFILGIPTAENSATSEQCSMAYARIPPGQLLFCHLWRLSFTIEKVPYPHNQMCLPLVHLRLNINRKITAEFPEVTEN